MKKHKQRTTELDRHEVLSVGRVVPDSRRCVQCGICSYNCPIGVNVREYSWLNQPVIDSHCLACGECVKRCPRGVLQFEGIPQIEGYSLRKTGAD